MPKKNIILVEKTCLKIFKASIEIVYSLNLVDFTI